MLSAVISLNEVLRPCHPSDDLQIAGEVVDRWTARWDWDDISKDMLWLGRHFWATLVDRPDETPIVWHHLVLAVGNFKRQTPIQGIGIGRSEIEATPQPSFTAPGLDLTVSKEDPESWKGLGDAVRGLGVPTTSTLLSVLWPDVHVVIDRFAFRSAVALRASIGGISRQGRKGEVRPDDTKPLGDEVTWLDYDDYRRWVVCTAAAIGRSVVMVERLLYLLRIDELPDWTWARRGEDLRRKADAGPRR